jgi:membrane protein implicated in regulation of membrane protease activity
VFLLVAIAVKILWIDSAWGWALIALGAVVELAESYLWVHWSRRRRPKVGTEDMIGREAVVVTPCHPDGQVRVFGELWQARCESRADIGERVVVERVDGLKLTVKLPG